MTEKKNQKNINAEIEHLLDKKILEAKLVVAEKRLQFVLGFGGGARQIARIRKD